MSNSNPGIMEYVLRIQSTGKTPPIAMQNIHALAHAVVANELGLQIEKIEKGVNSIDVFDIVLEKHTSLDPSLNQYKIEGKVKILRKLTSEELDELIIQADE